MSAISAMFMGKSEGFYPQFCETEVSKTSWEIDL